MKNLDEIWQDYVDHDEVLPPQTMKDLIWHIDHDELPEGAVLLATDMHLTQLGPIMAKHLDHEDDYVRQVTVGCVIGRLKLPEYAERALDMAINDPDGGPRDLAISNLGAVIDQVNNSLRRKIAFHLFDVLTKSNYDALHKQAAYDSIIKAMKISPTQWPSSKLDPDLSNLIDPDLMEQFKKKYQI